MTDSQRATLLYWRKEKDDAANDLARAVLGKEYADFDAKRVQHATNRIAQIAMDAHCPDCGAPTGECSPTCGYDGPTPSDAMADGMESAHAD